MCHDVAMQVLAFCTPANTSWRWRIVSYSGDIVEESHQVFPSIATAVAQGAKRLVEMNVVDRTVAVLLGTARTRVRFSV